MLSTLSASMSNHTKQVTKQARKMKNWSKDLQSANKLFANQEAEAHIVNQGIANIFTEIKEVGATTHDKCGTTNLGPNQPLISGTTTSSPPQAFVSKEKK